MKDEKKFDEKSKSDIILEKKSAENEYSKNELTDELERLAQTFRDELEKAQKLSDEEFVEVFADDLGVIEDKDLCECCGERRKDKSHGANYQYCSVCRDNMKFYPLSISGILTAVVLTIVAVMSVYSFCTDFYGYDLVYKGEKAQAEHKLDTAIEYYDLAIVEFAEAGITPKKAIFNSCDVIFLTMDNGANSMYNIAERIDNALMDFERDLPIYKSYNDLREECLVLFNTMQLFHTEILGSEEYANYNAEDAEMYDKIIAEIGSFADREVSVVSSDGKTTKMLPADEGMVRFLQYMFAYISGNYDDSYEYMLQTAEIAPEYVWLYAYELGVVETQTGDLAKAKELADKIIEINVEDIEGYCLYSSAERLFGNYQKSLRWAEKGLEYNASSAELMRMKAMTLVCLGETEKAKETIDKAYNSLSNSDNYGAIIFTAIVIENELGNTANVESYMATLEEEEIELSEKMEQYLSGKITAEQMFAEGTGEVQ